MLARYLRKRHAPLVLLLAVALVAVSRWPSPSLARTAFLPLIALLVASVVVAVLSLGYHTAAAYVEGVEEGKNQ